MTDCNVIADLIPLYIDNTCSKESSELIEEHIKTCEGCKKLIEIMRTEGIEPSAQAPKLGSKKLFKNVRKSLLTILLSLGIMMLSYSLHYFGVNRFNSFFSIVFTVMYIAAWMVLTIHVKDIIPLITVNLSFSLITFLYAAFRLITRILYLTDIITAGAYVKATSNTIALAPVYYLISIPYWGVASFTKDWWISINLVSSTVSLAVVIYSIISLKNWKKYRS